MSVCPVSVDLTSVLCLSDCLSCIFVFCQYAFPCTVRLSIPYLSSVCLSVHLSVSFMFVSICSHSTFLSISPAFCQCLFILCYACFQTKSSEPDDEGPSGKGVPGEVTVVSYRQRNLLFNLS